MMVSLRREEEADGPFVRQTILATLAIELGADAWPEAIRGPLLESQWRTRRHGAEAAHRGGESRIILADGEPAGWLFTATAGDHVWLSEIMVQPEFRGRGVGSAALGQVIAEAERDGKPVRLAVNRLNAGAIRLYERAGFVRTGGDEVQHYLERRA